MSATASGPPRRILPIIIISQFAGTSLWFAGNAVLDDLREQWGLGVDAVGYVTSAVQLGFIAGTLAFAVFALSDRYSPRKVFFVCAFAGAFLNLCVYFADGLGPLVVLRFATGFFLAGIYPVGMKIAAGWYQRDLGNAIGFLVGALVLGTAFPHLLKGMSHALPWETIVVAVSATAAFGGVLMLTLVPDGPYSTSGAKFEPRALASIFRSREFRASAFGYFGHMWELYAFWAFLPVVLAAHVAARASGELNIPWWTFWVIAAGAIGCVGGGLASLRLGSARVAFSQLLVSGFCCLASPAFFHAPTPLFLACLVVWGIAVVGDSPQFSALNAQNAPKGLVGSALTIVNCVGFSITIVSIQLLNGLVSVVGADYLYVALALGPALGLAALMPLIRGGYPRP